MSSACPTDLLDAATDLIDEGMTALSDQLGTLTQGAGGITDSLSTLAADMTASISTITDSLTALIPELPAIPEIPEIPTSYQDEMATLLGLVTSPVAYAAKMLEMSDTFGIDISEITSSITGLLAGTLDICNDIPDIDAFADGTLEEKFSAAVTPLEDVAALEIPVIPKSLFEITPILPDIAEVNLIDADMISAFNKPPVMPVFADPVASPSLKTFSPMFAKDIIFSKKDMDAAVTDYVQSGFLSDKAATDSFNKSFEFRKKGLLNTMDTLQQKGEDIQAMQAKLLGLEEGYEVGPAEPPDGAER
ncbi:MAG: hypothetical protein HN929_11675 [Chloroflexi bacterium]|jgi:hypothetical protein|nr:hypothetical protein [Chloroflexota bacterium]